MGNMRIEKLLTDLKNLPKETAGEDFEQKLLERINQYEARQSLDWSEKLIGIKRIFNPILAPALTILMAFGIIYYYLDKNNFQSQHFSGEIDRAKPIIVEEENEIITPPTKIKTPKKKDIVITKVRVPLNLGPGVSLDEKLSIESSFENISNERLIDFPNINKPFQIRIPPPNINFDEEFENFIFMGRTKDSIRLVNSKNR